MENEIWKAVAGYEGLYEVSDQGRVRSLVQRKGWKPRILKPGKNAPNGYLKVILCKDGKGKPMKVHRLVAEAFVPNPQALPQINHIDENKLNNAASNLEWCSASYNINYGTHNRRVAEALSKPVQMLDKSTSKVLATFQSLMEAERATGIRHSNICACCRGWYKSAGGYVWQYA